MTETFTVGRKRRSEKLHVASGASIVALWGPKSQRSQASVRGARDANLSPAIQTLGFEFRIRKGAESMGGETYTLIGRRNQGPGELSAASGL